MSDQFFTDIVPEGQPISATLDGGRFRIYAHHSVLDLPGHYDQHKHCNCYFALGAYQGLDVGELTKPVENGLLTDPVGGRAWGFDLDVGTGKHKYKSLQAAAQALQQAIESGAILNPSWVVQTGGGIQFFYVLPESDLVTPERWKYYQQRLKALMREAFNNRIDPKPGSRLHTWFRAPGTWNHNYGTPRETKVLFEGDWHTEDVLADLVIDVEIKQKKPGKHKRTDSTVSAYDRVDTETLNKACGFMRHQHTTGGADASEPDWCMVANIAGHTLGMSDYFHACSERYEGYDHDEAQDKYEHIYNATSAGPWGCGEAQDTDHCRRCWVQQNDAVRNPIEAARYWDKHGPQFYTESPPANPSPAADPPADDPPKTVKPIDMPATHEEVKYDYDIYDKEDRDRLGIDDFDCREKKNELWLSDSHVGDLLMVLGTHVNDKTRAATLHVGRPFMAKEAIPAESLGSPVRLAQALTRLGFECHNPVVMSQWLQKLAFRRDPLRECPGMGWEDSYEGFYMPGHTVYGEEVYPSNNVRNIVRKWYGREGTVNGWVEAMQLLDRPKQFPALMTLLASLAAPLLSYLNLEHGLIFALHGAPGIGKTTALRIANSVWGQPLESIGRFSDSAVALPRIVGCCRHLPVTVDEYTHILPETLQGWAMNMSQGEFRTSLTKERDLQENDQWQTIMMTTGNASYREIIAQVENMAGADLSRVYEVRMTKVDDDFSDANKLKTLLDSNHGLFGELFINTLVSRPQRDWLNAAAQVSDNLYREYGLGGVDRFSQSLIIAAHIAHRVAKQAHPEFPGDIQDTYERMVQFSLSSQEHRRNLVRHSLPNVDDFIYTFSRNDFILSPRKDNEYKTDVENKDPGFLFEKDSRIVVPYSDLKKWCRSNRVNLQKMLDTWIISGQLLRISGASDNPRYVEKASQVLPGFKLNNKSLGNLDVIVVIRKEDVISKFRTLREYKRKQAERDYGSNR